MICDFLAGHWKKPRADLGGDRGPRGHRRFGRREQGFGHLGLPTSDLTRSSFGKAPVSINLRRASNWPALRDPRARRLHSPALRAPHRSARSHSKSRSSPALQRRAHPGHANRGPRPSHHLAPGSARAPSPTAAALARPTTRPMTPTLEQLWRFLLRPPARSLAVGALMRQQIARNRSTASAGQDQSDGDGAGPTSIFMTGASLVSLASADAPSSMWRVRSMKIGSMASASKAGSTARRHQTPSAITIGSMDTRRCRNRCRPECHRAALPPASWRSGASCRNSTRKCTRGLSR